MDTSKEIIAVIYHRSDWDGLACRYIAQQVFPQAAFFGWHYGDAVPNVDGFTKIFVMDISIIQLFDRPEIASKIVWIDHHQTAIDQFENVKFLSKLCLSGVAACRLAWQYFHCPLYRFDWKISDYRERYVNEPNLIRWIGEHDVADRRDPLAAVVNVGMNVVEQDALIRYLNQSPDDRVDLESRVLSHGQVAIKIQSNLFNQIASSAYKISWMNRDWWVINTPLKGSQQFECLDKRDRECFLRWSYDGKIVDVSLYTDNKNIDLSIIAKRLGGGGHPGACGFRCSLSDASNWGLIR